jgi:hypothetical protein
MRNRDNRGRFRGNSKQEKDPKTIFGGRQGSVTTSADRYSEKKQQKGETSTQKAIETEIEILAEETIEGNIGLEEETPKIGLKVTIQYLKNFNQH